MSVQSTLQQVRSRLGGISRRFAGAALNNRILRKGVQKAMDIPIDPFDPAFRQDPYPFYHKLREAAPVYKSPMGIWLVSRYDDCRTVMIDHRFGHPDYNAMPVPPEGLQAGEVLRRNCMIGKNPPEHGNHRKFLNPLFERGKMEALRPRMESRANALIDTYCDQGRMDVVGDYSLPLALGMISECLGVPDEDVEYLRQWVPGIITVFGVAPTDGRMEEGHNSSRHVIDYFNGLIADRKREPRDDMVSAVVASQEEGGFTDDEVVTTCILLFIAGHANNANLITNGILTFMRHPAQMEMVLKDPSLLKGAVEEVLRYESPMQFFGRMTLEDVTLRDQLIPKGETVYVITGAANHDPARFDDPDTFDITREDNQHVAFGYGTHNCVGSMFGRIIGQTGIGTVLKRLKNMKLESDDIEWFEELGARGPRKLPVFFDS